MILVLIMVALLSCDHPALTSLFTPSGPGVGRYEVCTTSQSLDRVMREASSEESKTHYGPANLLEALDAFGAAGRYDRGALARLYGGKRVRVARGWIDRPDRFESLTLLSPYPDPTLTRLLPGTMVIRWTTPRN
jgi:hypothetical protein